MLVTLKEIVDNAAKNGYAVAAPNIFSELDARAYVEAAEELNAPVILDVAYGAHPDIITFGKLVCELARQASVPVAVSLDHGASMQQVAAALRAGFTGVMLDCSVLPFEENVARVREVVELAHSVGVSVEAELGHVGQAANYDVDRNSALTDVGDACRYIEATGLDCLAVAIGTAHGAYPKGYQPYLDFERLAQIKAATGGFPLVLHGSSGTGLEQIRKACTMGINKVNIANDLCRAAVDALKAADLEGQGAYDVWNVGRNGAKKKLKQMMEIYGSVGKSWCPASPGLPKKAVTLEEK